MDKQQRKVLWVAIVTAFITTFMGSALTLAIPTLEKALQTDAQAAGWVVTVYMLVCGALAIPFGRVADIIDRRIILKWGIFVFGAASAAAVMSGRLWMLLVFRGLQGIGASMIFATNLAILTASAGQEHHGKVLGYATCANYAGLSAGPVAGGILNYQFGWQSIFLVTAAVSGLALTGALLWLKPSKKQQKHHGSLDWPGNLCLVTSIFLTLYGCNVLKDDHFGVYLAGTGILIFLAFLKIEECAACPAVDVKRLGQKRGYLLSNLAAFASYGINFAITYLLSLHMQQELGYTSQRAGLILVIQAVVLSLCSLAAGWMSDRVSPQILAGIGMVLCIGSFAWMELLGSEAGLGQIVVILAVSGVGFGLFATPNTKAVVSCVEAQDYGVATAILASMRSLGHTAAMTLISFGIF